MINAEFLIKNLERDGLAPTHIHFINVRDTTCSPACHVCNIDLIDKTILFEKEYVVKGMMIPTIRILLERGFSSNGISTDSDLNGRSVFDIYPTRSASDVMTSYVFKDNHVVMLIWPHKKHKERFDDLVRHSFCVEVIAENTEKPMVLVTDLSNKDLHNRWIMTIDAWNTINPNKDETNDEENETREV